jgi:opacity protein-like surface antigen
MKVSARMATAVGLVLLCALPASAADVTGKWTAEFDTQVGPQKYVFDLKSDAGKVTGTATFERMGQKGEAELKDGKLTGDDISFVEMLDFQGTPVALTYTGKVVGDEIKFTRTVGDFAKEDFVAKRVKP